MRARELSFYLGFFIGSVAGIFAHSWATQDYINPHKIKATKLQCEDELPRYQECLNVWLPKESK